MDAVCCKKNGNFRFSKKKFSLYQCCSLQGNPNWKSHNNVWFSSSPKELWISVIAVAFSSFKDIFLTSFMLTEQHPIKFFFPVCGTIQSLTGQCSLKTMTKTSLRYVNDSVFTWCKSDLQNEIELHLLEDFTEYFQCTTKQ